MLNIKLPWEHNLTPTPKGCPPPPKNPNCHSTTYLTQLSLLTLNMNRDIDTAEYSQVPHPLIPPRRNPGKAYWNLLFGGENQIKNIRNTLLQTTGKTFSYRNEVTPLLQSTLLLVRLHYTSTPKVQYLRAF